MRDAGKDIHRIKGDTQLCETVQKMMDKWTADNFTYFQQTMELIREGAPVQWVKLYMDAVKMGLVKETNFNININHQQDREDLQALVRSRIPSPLPPTGTYTPYEEVMPKKIAVKEEKGVI